MNQVAARATQIAQMYTVVWIQVSTYRKCFRGTYRTVAVIGYRPPRHPSRHRPQMVSVDVQKIHNATDWQNGLQQAFQMGQLGQLCPSDNSSSYARRIVGINMDAYYSIQSRVRNKVRNIVADVGLNELGSIGSGMQAFNGVMNRKFFGGDMNLINEPRWLSVFYTNGA